jgi:hypothetical protein
VQIFLYAHARCLYVHSPKLCIVEKNSKYQKCYYWRDNPKIIYLINYKSLSCDKISYI